MRRIRVLAAVVGLFGAQAAQAQYAVNFNSDALGNKANGFQSAQSNKVSFSATGAGQLFIYNGPETNSSNGLAANPDAGDVGIMMTFTEFMQSVSFDFGNDDPRWTTAAGKANLTLYNGAVQVGFVSMFVNANDLMDQTMSYSGASFDHALFQYAPDIQSSGLAEVMDNLQFAPATTVPEPSTYVLMAAGLAGLGVLSRRRKA